MPFSDQSGTFFKQSNQFLFIVFPFEIHLCYLQIKKCWDGKIVHPKNNNNEIKTQVPLVSELIISTGRFYKACTKKVKRSSARVARSAHNMGLPQTASPLTRNIF